jgi:hypothetical protein
MGSRNASGESSHSASTIRHVSNEAKSITSGESHNGDNQNRKPSTESELSFITTLHQTSSEASYTTRTTLRKTSNETTSTSRTINSESKPVSKVKALAQAFNNLAGPNGHVKRKKSVSKHKRDDSWTEKLRRSMHLSSQKNDPELVAMGEEIEPKSDVGEGYGDGDVKVELVDVGKEEGIKDVVHLANSPPSSPSLAATDPREEEFQRAISSPSSTAHATILSPTFPDIPSTHAFLGSRLNHKSSSIYSQPHSTDTSPRKTPQKSPTPKVAPLSISKRPSLLTSPSKSPSLSSHRRSQVNSGTPTKTSELGHSRTSGGVDHSAYLAEDYTTYLDTNFPAGTPPPIPERNAARLQTPTRASIFELPELLRPSNLGNRASRKGEGGVRMYSDDRRVQGLMRDANDLYHPVQVASADEQSPSTCHLSDPREENSARLFQAAKSKGNASNSHNSNVRSNDHAHDTSDISANGTPAFVATRRAQTNKAALQRLKREAMDLSRFSEKSTEGLVGKENFAWEEGREDGSSYIWCTRVERIDGRNGW